MRRIEIDERFYRIRRGRLVEIPQEWLGRTVDPQTIRKRRSKMSALQRKQICSHPTREGYFTTWKYRRFKLGVSKHGLE